MRNLARPLLGFTALALLAAAPASADDLATRFANEAPRLDEISIGNWRGYAFADPDTGAFTDCEIGIGTASADAYLNFWMTGNGALKINLHRLGSDLAVGDTVETALAFNRSRAHPYMAEAATTETLTLAIDDMDRVSERLRNANRLTIRVGDALYPVNLAGSRRALEWLASCAERGVRANPPQPSPAPRTAESAILDELDAAAGAAPKGEAPTPPAAPATALPPPQAAPLAADTRTAVALANALSAAEVGLFRLAVTDAVVSFASGSLTGTLRPLTAAEAGDMHALRTRLITESAGACLGAYSAQNETPKGLVTLSLATRCTTETGQTGRLIAVFGSGEGGLVLTAMSAESDASTLAEALVARLSDELSTQE
ncbi:hypothetical protein [Acuticoccus mangrovi]|uniref:Serine hydrolase n=1 Tax=Acuticoccus mangrovi TaxID=2796142 RepID=A0A934MFE3_9HYPH|nr:hypothetical protein [Acuticoccus mangrovi]MBJ3775378.1 hypothetical protein [Acuticoccus mangrovi]